MLINFEKVEKKSNSDPFINNLYRGLGVSGKPTLFILNLLYTKILLSDFLRELIQWARGGVC